MNTSKHTDEKGSPRQIYFDSEAKSILDFYAIELGFPYAKIVCGLLRALDGRPPKSGEERIVKILKKVFGQEQFIAFLRGVGIAIHGHAIPIMPPKDGRDHADEFKPDTWLGTFGKEKSLFIAFFAPTAENIGTLITKCIREKEQHKADLVTVVCNDTSGIPRKQREDFLKIGIGFVCLADLKGLLKDMLESSKKPTRRKQTP